MPATRTNNQRSTIRLGLGYGQKPRFMPVTPIEILRPVKRAPTPNKLFHTTHGSAPYAVPVRATYPIDSTDLEWLASDLLQCHSPPRRPNVSVASHFDTSLSEPVLSSYSTEVFATSEGASHVHLPSIPINDDVVMNDYFENELLLPKLVSIPLHHAQSVQLKPKHAATPFDRAMAKYDEMDRQFKARSQMMRAKNVRPADQLELIDLAHELTTSGMVNEFFSLDDLMLDDFLTDGPSASSSAPTTPDTCSAAEMATFSKEYNVEDFVKEPAVDNVEDIDGFEALFSGEFDITTLLPQLIELPAQCTEVAVEHESGIDWGSDCDDEEAQAGYQTADCDARTFQEIDGEDDEHDESLVDDEPKPLMDALLAKPRKFVIVSTDKTKPNTEVNYAPRSSPLTTFLPPQSWAQELAAEEELCRLIGATSALTTL
ncbi:hypothetical protein PYCC9005_004167 [Savitreella phatthalungensis]